MNRRDFIFCTAAGLAGSSCIVRAQAVQPRLLFGVCAPVEKAEGLKAAGYDFIEGNTGPTLKPELSDVDFAPELEKLKACVLPVRSCTGFIPKNIPLTGPAAEHDKALDYALKVCRRADAAGLSFIVLGSGGARNVPEGFDMDKGKAQFLGFCKSLAERIKDLKVTIVLEPLNKAECNIFHTVAEGIEYVDEVSSPRIQLLADIYHMQKEGEKPDVLRKAGSRIRHCHIAELEKRAAPGTKGEDLSGYFNALKDIGYNGGVSCECGWPKTNVEEGWKKALETMRKQSGM